jgi:hypothetical protein
MLSPRSKKRPYPIKLRDETIKKLKLTSKKLKMDLNDTILTLINSWGGTKNG